MRTRVSLIGLVLVLAASILVLTPIAYASPPDPTWIPGLWDDDDSDNVVECVTSAAGVVHAPIGRELGPVPVLAIPKLPAADAGAASIPLSASGPRSPPTV